MAQIINGKAIAASRRAALAERIAECVAVSGRSPGLAVIQVGDDPASTIYVRNKQKACQEAGIASFSHHLPEQTAARDVLALIDSLNRDAAVDGILCQLPLPSAMDAFETLRAIRPDKDVDGFHPYNVGLLTLGRPCPVPCTPAGVIAMLEHAGIDPNGKRAVVVGRSISVGKPLAQLLLAAHATVTVAHSRTRDLAEICRQADILIAAVGKVGVIGAEHVKPGAVVIDVGINRNADGKVVGDVDFAAVEPIAGWITPVPGGVGPMTIAMLLENTFQAFLETRRADLRT